MREKITEFLVIALAFVSAPFVTPEPPVIIEQPSEVTEELKQEEALPVETAAESKPAEPVVEVAPVKVVDPYCAQYAFRYSAEKYTSASEESKKVKKSCEKEKDKVDKDSIEALDYDCDAREKQAKKEFEAWKKKYEEYKVRCP